MHRSSLAGAVTLALIGPASAETVEYGSFRHFSDIPSVLFLVGEIGQKDSFELRRAMRDHEVSLVVAASAGGNLYEGLQMAAILRDRLIGTYIPPDVSCESSCANIFLGGAKRIVLGELGVHQFYSASGQADANAPQDATTAATQYTTSDIIGIMNEFDTPAFVYEKMFGTTEIYYFKATEKLKISIGTEDAAFLKSLEAVDAFIATNPYAIERPTELAPTPPPVEPAFQPNPAASLPGRIDRFEDVDFFGADINPTGFRDVSLLQCEAICHGEANCAAYSYVVATRWCWPKYGVTNISIAPGVLSGVKDYSLVDQTIFDRPFIEATAKDIPGYDLHPAGLKGRTLDECRSTCADTPSCKAFSWVSKRNWCFPKYGVGGFSDALGTISGIKN